MSDEQVFRAKVFSKSDHWAYEEEYRLMCAEQPDFKLALDSNIISRVLLGSNCSQDNERNMIELLKNRGDNLPVSQAIHRDMDYKIAFKEVKYA